MVRKKMEGDENHRRRLARLARRLGRQVALPAISEGPVAGP